MEPGCPWRKREKPDGRSVGRCQDENEKERKQAIGQVRRGRNDRERGERGASGTGSEREKRMEGRISFRGIIFHPPDPPLVRENLHPENMPSRRAPVAGVRLKLRFNVHRNGLAVAHLTSARCETQWRTFCGVASIRVDSCRFVPSCGFCRQILVEAWPWDQVG